MNSEDLKNRLESAEEGVVVELSDGEYEGPFLNTQNRIVLNGQGTNTVLKNPLLQTDPTAILCIKGNHCNIAGIKLVSNCNTYSYGIIVEGSDNTISNISFEGNSSLSCLKVNGNFNTVSDISISNSAGGIDIEGNGNKLSNIRADEVHDYISIKGNNNHVKSITAANVGTGIHVEGGDNQILNVEFRNDKIISTSTGVNIWEGDGNLVDNVTCLGFSQYGIKFGNSSTKSVIRNSVCDGLSLGGFDHNLINVNAGRTIVIHGGGHDLQNCKSGGCFNDGTNVTAINFRCGIGSGKGIKFRYEEG